MSGKAFGRLSVEHLAGFRAMRYAMDEQFGELHSILAKKQTEMAVYLGSNFIWHQFYSIPFMALPLLVIKTLGALDEFMAFIRDPNIVQVAIDEVIAGEFSLDSPDLTPAQFEQIFPMLTALKNQMRAINYYGYPLSDFLGRYLKSPTDEDLMLLLSIDFSLISLPSVQNRINIAKAVNDLVFEKKLASAMKEKPHKGRLPYQDLRYTLYALKIEGSIDSLTEESSYQLFCRELNYFPDDGDAGRSLWKFIERWRKEFPT